MARSVPGGHVSTEPPAPPRPWSCSRHLQQQVGPSQVSWCPLWTIDPEALVLIGPPREKRPHGPEESKRSPEKEQQRRSSPRRRCGSSEESAAPEESAPPPDWSHDSPWTRSRGRAAVEEQGAAGPEETLRRRASSQNHQEPEEKKKRSSSTAEQELSHQQGATSTPELLEDSQSQQAEPAGGATEHQNPAQPVGRSLTSPSCVHQQQQQEVMSASVIMAAACTSCFLRATWPSPRLQSSSSIMTAAPEAAEVS